MGRVGIPNSFTLYAKQKQSNLQCTRSLSPRAALTMYSIIVLRMEYGYSSWLCYIDTILKYTVQTAFSRPD